MKKQLLKVSFFAFAALMFMGSCKKTYHCHCSYKYSGVPGMPDSTTYEYDVTDTKDNAKTKCSNLSSQASQNYVSTKEDCYLY